MPNKDPHSTGTATQACSWAPLSAAGPATLLHCVDPRTADAVFSDMPCATCGGPHPHTNVPVTLGHGQVTLVTMLETKEVKIMQGLLRECPSCHIHGPAQLWHSTPSPHAPCAAVSLRSDSVARSEVITVKAAGQVLLCRQRCSSRHLLLVLLYRAVCR